MASYTIVTATAANVAGNTNTIASTKVKIVANAACVYAINAPATLTANVGAMIPANFPTYINMTGIGNRISVLPVAGVNTAITLTECGTVFQSAVNQIAQRLRILNYEITRIYPSSSQYVVCIQWTTAHSTSRHHSIWQTTPG